MGFFGWLIGSRRRRDATETGGATPSPSAPDPASIGAADVSAVAPSPTRPRLTRTQEIEGVTVVTFVSDHAFYGSPFPAREELLELVDVYGHRNLLLDFSGVEHIPSYALGLLITLHRRVRTEKGQLLLWRLNSGALDMMKLFRLDRILTIITERDCGSICAVIRAAYYDTTRPIVFAPEWRTETAMALARQMTESQDFSAMPILADALQEAGCDSAEILDHCRCVSPHIRGCWVVDLIMSK